MSVAFRRESDEEHKEPRFEIPLPAGPNLVTANGLAQTLAQLEALDAAMLEPTDPETLESIKRERRYWQTRAATAQLAPVPDGDEVAFGCRVTIRLNGVERTVDIVGDDEADPKAGRIAFSAPLARAIIGAEAGEAVDFGGKAGAVEIVAVGVIG